MELIEFLTRILMRELQQPHINNMINPIQIDSGKFGVIPNTIKRSYFISVYDLALCICHTRAEQPNELE